jgi:hypothetical protein
MVTIRIYFSSSGAVRVGGNPGRSWDEIRSRILDSILVPEPSDVD